MKKPVAPMLPTGNSPMNGERQQNETGNKIQIAHGAHFFFPALLNWPECTNQSQIMVNKKQKSFAHVVVFLEHPLHI